jgi:hypothetical protein
MEKAVNYTQRNSRTDEQLEAILSETGHWVVNGTQGYPLGFASSLRSALDRAMAFANSGAVVVSVVRLPFDNVVVTPSQMDRLHKAIGGGKVATVKQTDVHDDQLAAN